MQNFVSKVVEIPQKRFLKYLSCVCIKLDPKKQTRNHFIFSENSIALKIILEIGGNVKGKIYLEAPRPHCHPFLGA